MQYPAPTPMATLAPVLSRPTMPKVLPVETFTTSVEVPIFTAEAVWKDAGWGAIVFLAALSAIDQNLYEAAAADGAGRWRRLWHITLPGLRPVIILLLIMRLGDALSVGFEQFILQREAVGRQAAEVLDTFVYYQAIVPLRVERVTVRIPNLPEASDGTRIALLGDEHPRQ